MLNLQTVIIILGLIAIVGLILHGLWLSRKEKKSKFAQTRSEDKIASMKKRPSRYEDKPKTGDVILDEPQVSRPVVKKKARQEPAFSASQGRPNPSGVGASSRIKARPKKQPKPMVSPQITPEVEDDPLFSAPSAPTQGLAKSDQNLQPEASIDAHLTDELELSATSIENSSLQQTSHLSEEVNLAKDVLVQEQLNSELSNSQFAEPIMQDAPSQQDTLMQTDLDTSLIQKSTQLDSTMDADKVEPEIKIEPEAEIVEEDKGPMVIIVNVHTADDEPLNGAALFDSLEQSGLHYGNMDIYHRHIDAAGSGKVLFSVANMMHPGTLAHYNRDTFTTMGVCFFMTLPCVGDPTQNFKLMLRTAQQVADDLSADVLDENRARMTPNRIDEIHAQIREFKAKQNIA